VLKLICVSGPTLSVTTKSENQLIASCRATANHMLNFIINQCRASSPWRALLILRDRDVSEGSK
jgi:hypothetical protein